MTSDFAVEARVLLPLPAERFETGLTLSPRVDRHARVTVRQATYSVPARLIGQRVRALLRAEEVIVFDRRREVARHERSTVKGSTTVVLDHYLETLGRKPGALPGATALSQARAAGAFTATHDAFWAAARTAARHNGNGTSRGQAVHERVQDDRRVYKSAIGPAVCGVSRRVEEPRDAALHPQDLVVDAVESGAISGARDLPRDDTEQFSGLGD